MAAISGGESIPQIIGFASISKVGKIRLKKGILKKLGAVGSQYLFLDDTGEVLLSSEGKGRRVSLEKGHTIPLPNKLGLDNDHLICFIERPSALAMKVIVVAVEEADQPGIVDRETPTSLTRIVRTFPEPEVLLKQLERGTLGFLPREKLLEFWKHKETFAGYKARQYLFSREANDEELVQALIQKNIKQQLANGSWGDSVVLTARNIDELIELNLNLDSPVLLHAGQWLLSRPGSPHNPGMIFLSDELVGEQVALIERRKRQTKGPKERFRNRLRSEMKMVESYDPLFKDNVCGPRIMWPNALAMHALLRLGHEHHERVHSMIRFMTVNEWCECGWQHGLGDWRRKEPMSMDEICEYERAAIRQFRTGGLWGLESLTDEYRVTGDLVRFEHRKMDLTDEYTVRMPTHIQGCEVLTTYGASHVKNKHLRQFAEAHLWRFAGLLCTGMNQGVGGKKRLTLQEKHFDRVAFFLLKVFSEYNHPAAKLGILLAIPWLAKKQNPDGSWGEAGTIESATLGVTKALHSIGYFQR